ncbi:MAG: GtrA family protein [Candidatus Moranbacteria bacterium]|nr:GtrA family protein [Candidatus Moranbacteria bacterium]
MAKQTNVSADEIATKGDYEASIVAGLLIGLLALPILSTARPDLYGKMSVVVPLFFLIASPAGIFIASKLSRKIPIVWQLAKFVLIGGLNTLVDIGILAALMALFQKTSGIDPDSVIAKVGIVTISFFVVYKAVSFLIANISSFFWNKYWTFSGNSSKSGRQFVQFLTVSIIGFLINIFFSSYIFNSVHPVIGMNPSQWGLVCGAFGSIAGLAWNFVGYKFIVFKR